MKILVAVALAMMVGEQPARRGDETSVHVRMQRVGDRTIYRFTVRNRGNETVSSIFIGVAEGIDEAELASAPEGWRPQTNDCPNSVAGPNGWTGCVGRQEESAKFFLSFEALQERAELAPGASLEFAVTLAQRDGSYERAIFWAIRSTGGSDISRVVIQSGR